MKTPHITWENNRYRMGDYDGFFTDHPQVRVEKLDDEGNAIIHWDKWVYYTISVWDSEEDYHNNDENMEHETLAYVGIEGDVPEHSECSNQELLDVLWYELKEGAIISVYPRRYCSVEMHLPSGEVNWDTHEWGESYTDRTLILRNGKMELYEE